MTRTCRQETFAEARESIEALMLTQWAETGDTTLPLDPNWQMYELMERTGRLVILVLREDGRAVGYAGGMVHPHMNSKTVSVATIPTWYVEPTPEAPTKRAFVEKALLQEVARRLVALGARRVTIETHADKNAARLLEVMGYRPTKLCFSIDAVTVQQEKVSA